MPDPMPSVDGVKPPASVPPQAAPQQNAQQTQSVRRWKKFILVTGVLFYVLFALWCFVLLALLPSPTGDLRELVPIGVGTCVAGGLVFLGILGISLLRVSEAEVSKQTRIISLIKSALICAPGLALSVLTPMSIIREPALSLDIMNPTLASEMVAPVTMTFSVEKAVNILKQRDFKPIQYKWDLDGDRKVDEQTVTPNLTVTFDREGVYTVSVSMVAANGAVRAATRRFVIQQAVFSVVPNPPIIDKPVVFDVGHLLTDIDMLQEVQWDFDGDNKVDEKSTTPQANYTFYKTGPVNVSALVILANRTQARYERTITVQDPPTLPFPISLNTLPKHLISPPPFFVIFSVETQEPLAQVLWTIGSEKKEGKQVPHTFANRGTFPVTARVRSQSGVFVELSTVVQVVEPLQLTDLTFEGTPSIVSNRIEGEVPLTLNIRPRTAKPFVQFMWEVPEATEVGSTEGNLQAIFRREGSYSVTLIGQDLENHVMRMQIPVMVRPPSSFVSILMNPEEGGVAPLTVTFDASETTIPGERIQGFEWTFENAQSPLIGGARVEHTFKNPGTYEVSVIVRTDKDATGKYRQRIPVTIRPPLVTACMLPSRKRGPSPLGVQFNNCSTGTYKKVLWDFGDGAQSDLVMPSHTYAQPGTYKVTLVLTDTVGKEYTSAPVEIVVDPPQPTFP